MKTSVRFLLQLITFSCFCSWLTLRPLYAQMRVGQPAGSPDPSAALDISGGPYNSGSPYRGILPPKVALSQTAVAAPITSPATGLLVYNTAKVGDVAPGYYYWEGSKWVRLSATAAGAAREAIVTAGAPVPEYTLAQARSLTTAPGFYSAVSPAVFMLVEEGKEGLFRYDFGLTYADPNHPEWYPTDDGTMVIVTAGRSERGDRTTYRRVYDSEINVRWFGAKGDGVTDDSKAIQDAVDYARSKGKLNGQLPLYAGSGGLYRTTVLIPEGSYLIGKTIDITNSNGIVIKGVGGRYINTMITGATGGAIFDFTGSTMAGCENLTIGSAAWQTNRSTIGVQFALGSNAQGQTGGLNCSINNCYFQMADFPSANNGIGTIGILNCRSEEFSVTSCLIKANIGVILSYKNDLSDAGLSYAISSPYATVATGQGSMGVLNFSGQNSIQNYGKAQPALILNGTNSVNFHGYLGRASNTGSGTNEAAILFSGPATYNATINGTIESFAQLMQVKGSLLNSTINAVVANQTNAGSSFPAGTTRPAVIDLTGGARIHGSNVSVLFGNGQTEMGGRYLLYDGGPTVAYKQIFNSEIICHDWTSNAYVASVNLLANSENVNFKIAQPFEKKSVALMNAVINSQNFSTVDWTTTSYKQIVPVGTFSSTKLYVMKVIWGQSGVDQVVQSYVFAVSGTDFNPTAPVLPILTPTSTITWGNAGRSVNIRYKAPIVSGQTTYGLEAKINTADMNNGTLTITIAPLL